MYPVKEEEIIIPFQQIQEVVQPVKKKRERKVGAIKIKVKVEGEIKKRRDGFICKEKLESGEACGNFQKYKGWLDDIIKERCNPCYRKQNDLPEEIKVLKVKLNAEERSKQKHRLYKCCECKQEKRYEDHK